MEEITTSDEIAPSYLEYLTDQDRLAYENLKQKVGSPDNRYNRNKRLETFIEILNEIRIFCVRNDGDDWKRYLACGICWLGPDLALNTCQLRNLLSKSKSTVNGVLAKLGYDPVPLNSKNSTLLFMKIPFLKTHFNEMRQWTLRRMIYTSNQYMPYAPIYVPIGITNDINNNNDFHAVNVASAALINSVSNACFIGQAFNTACQKSNQFYSQNIYNCTNSSQNCQNHPRKTKKSTSNKICVRLNLNKIKTNESSLKIEEMNENHQNCEKNELINENSISLSNETIQHSSSEIQLFENADTNTNNNINNYIVPYYSANVVNTGGNVNINCCSFNKNVNIEAGERSAYNLCLEEDFEENITKCEEKESINNFYCDTFESFMFFDECGKSDPEQSDDYFNGSYL
ncbi:hypothetical protein TRFO_19314 [Tritrichomonas foetus]|uniref:Initiator binding domain-containing protein n=1 Tax=Tritrichomonas foetus TaxID=1144522 RepID=A0A1J4KNQ5_9EUKA|nr:hypothetical protein TRFO_19314 [Tritrichomonas foetus]|eukprot:OHT11326.1 hypothetical protein TRFO_19314 [Tritrichomonas foetus]